MAPRTVFCTNPRCGRGIVIDREVPAQCPHCGSSSWRSAKTPATPYKLSHKDRIFLRCQRIDPTK